ncbi:outer membrane lipoprotein Slp [Methylophaga frappieri]|uniref:Outer membrane lipoprotein Slp n=1 Tax=Methylophaga frappieri (strain ATCC BAA-2434 / DSM 25690 / JAM7) TaxID=754477 RepID=I1YIK6_METFJ|nr:Slp family lipoprotein [Methylophaga frappieri]AFJ02749.1 outer membrane lipoprotein Slp [Methylophaga frappieri]
MRLLMLLLSFALAGCAMQPANPWQPRAQDISLNDVLNSPDSNLQAPILWGGVIVDISNKPDGATLTIVAFPLSPDGKPLTTQSSAGRFVVESDGFLDPLIYAPDTLITVTGSVSAIRHITIDQKTLSVPLVVLKNAKVWPEKYADRRRPYNPKHDLPFAGYGYYGTGSFSP